MLPAERASAIGGLHYTAEKRGNNMCMYTPAEGPVTMGVVIRTGTGEAAWKAQLTSMKDDGQLSMINGVGDRAAGAGTRFAAQIGDRMILVQGGDPNSASNVFDKSAEMAKALIAALH